MEGEHIVVRFHLNQAATMYVVSNKVTGGLPVVEAAVGTH
jgi:hypothetical protein